MEDAAGLDDVGATALGVAWVRAEESRRADRLFCDPYAEAFVAAAPDLLPEARDDTPVGGDLAEVGAVFVVHAVVRARFFDDYLHVAGVAGCRQVVLLAAGLDTRAFRLSWPGQTRLFELDSAVVLGFKQRVLSEHAACPSCERRPVVSDLRLDWPSALANAGFNPGEPTAWLAEGLLTYLTAEHADRLLHTITALSAPRSHLALEAAALTGPDLLARARAIPALQRFTALWQGGLSADPAEWLAEHGWTAQTHRVGDLATSYGRPAPGSARGRLIAATR